MLRCRVLADQHQQVAIASGGEDGPPQLEITHVDPQLPVDAAGAPPSARCVDREEWQGECLMWSGKPRNRYLEFKHLHSGEGIGANMMRIAWALDRAITFDLEPVFLGTFRVGHGTGDIGRWVGLTHNSLLAVRDPAGYRNASSETVPFPEGNKDDWFRAQENRTSVVYKAMPTGVKKIHDWGFPVSHPNPDPQVCTYTRQALRNIYWNAPPTRGRCISLLPDDTSLPPWSTASATTRSRHGGKRPWVIAVHVRRGDIIKFRRGVRSIPQTYFSAALDSVLRAIAVIDPAAHVSVLVFSEGPDTLEGLQLDDEHGSPVTWDIRSESCVDVGLTCNQV